MVIIKTLTAASESVLDKELRIITTEASHVKDMHFWWHWKPVPQRNEVFYLTEISQFNIHFLRSSYVWRKSIGTYHFCKTWQVLSKISRSQEMSVFFPELITAERQNFEFNGPLDLRFSHLSIKAWRSPLWVFPLSTSAKYFRLLDFTSFFQPSPHRLETHPQ